MSRSNEARKATRPGADVWRKMGNIRLQRNEREDALQCWEAALALEPDDTRLRANINAVRASP